jgi:hypothetical protein
VEHLPVSALRRFIALSPLRAGERGRAGRSRLGGEAMVPRGGIEFIKKINLLAESGTANDPMALLAFLS